MRVALRVTRRHTEGGADRLIQHYSSPTEKGNTMSVTNRCAYGTCTHAEHQRPEQRAAVQRKIVRARLFAAVEGVRRYVVPVTHQSPLDSKMGQER